MPSSAPPRGQEARRRRVTRFAVKPAPYAKRSIGPKLFAADAPMKYRPGTDDSKCRPSLGVSFTLSMRANIAASRKGSRDSATL